MKKATLKPKDGFDWRLVHWGGPKERVSDRCSYRPCNAVIGDDEVPLMLWSPEGAMAQFCDKCCREWWGVE